MTGFDRLAPLYAQVKRSLQARIEAGELKEGDFLPPESRLCADFGVSRITLRRAVKELCDTGLLIRQQGRGTVVARRKLRQALVSLQGFSDMVDATGGTVRHRVLAAERAVTDAAAQAALGAAKPLVRLLRLIELDGNPLTLETLFFDPAYLPGVFEPVAGGASFFRTLRRASAPEPHAAARTINVGVASTDERRYLRIPPSQPVFRIDKTLLGAGDAPIALSLLVTPTNLITYSMRS